MTRTALLLACLACLAGLPGCAGMGLAFVGANMATLMHTDKTIPDIMLSEQRGKDCSLLHAANNEPYCQSAPEDPRQVLAKLAETRYCYRTIGAITCYDRPDYMASAETRLRFDSGYLSEGHDPAPDLASAAPAMEPSAAPAMAAAPTDVPEMAPPAAPPAAPIPPPAAPAAKMPPLEPVPGLGPY